ncbi:hypothetical protein EYC80_001799 [Monilinia laxa]|uniref:NAD(P)-binding domain-containing protein n=1 Tax=Monilinia laxa TaxID=61186 RepID=A0A5N6K6T7_MONLA|nr:hypothetical protein EYC80_001799 [Monilinia laxa]
MEGGVIYFITGANRGIGFQLTRALLLRENTTVVATKRGLETSSVDLEGLPRAENSRIDVLILNAGAATSFESARETRMEELWAHFEVQQIVVLRGKKVFWMSRGWLVDDKGGDGERHKQKKIVYISSFLGSIEGTDDATPSLAYGISKAGANYFVRKVHFEEGGEGSGIVSLAVHPGWIKTQNGQTFADSVGVEEPPMSLEESVEGVLGQIDTATRETTSGKFVSHNGAIIPW